MEIIIKNLQKKIPIRPRQIIPALHKILRSQGLAETALCITFVSAYKMRVLNKKYLNHDYVTDVLTFDFSENKNTIAGEIVIAPSQALKNSRIYRTALNQEILLYVIHGMLHLLGYKDHHPADIKRMRTREEQLMKLLKIFLLIFLPGTLYSLPLAL